MKRCLPGILLLCLARVAFSADYRYGVATASLMPGASAEVVAADVRSAASPQQSVQPGPFADGLGLGLSARAVCIAPKNGATPPIVLVTADLISLCAYDADQVRNHDYQVQGLSRDRILINISHTHTAPYSCDTSMRVQGAFEDETVQQRVVGGASREGAWRKFVVAQLIQVVQSAVSAATSQGAGEASLFFHRGQWGARGFNRHHLNAGAVGFGSLSDPSGLAENDSNGYDHTVDVVTLRRDDGGMPAVLFFYGMHPTALGSGILGAAPAGTYLHPDYPGFARSTIEAAIAGTTALFFQAGGGNVNPVRTCVPSYGCARDVGNELGGVVNALIATGGTRILPDRAMSAFDRVWAAPLQTATGAGRVGGLLGEPQGASAPATQAGHPSTHMWKRWADHFCLGTTGHGGANPPCSVQGTIRLERSMDVELQSITIGDWRIAALSHEPVSRYGLRVRQNWPGERVTFVGYANREQTYLPNSEMVDTDDACAAVKGCIDLEQKGFVGYEGFTAQILNGLPASWATARTTPIPAAAGGRYDLDAEVGAALRLAKEPAAPALVNYALGIHGSLAEAVSMTGFDAAAVINGDRTAQGWGGNPSTGSGWHGALANPSPSNPDTITIRFNAPRTIETIAIHTLHDNFPGDPTGADALQYGIEDFEVQYLDRTSWLSESVSASWISVAPKVVGNTKAATTLAFAPVTTTRIRVVVTKARNATAPYARIVEIEAYGKPTARANAARTSGAQPTATTTEPGRPAAAAIDGDRIGVPLGNSGSAWSGWHSQDGHALPQSLTVDFGAAYPIHEVRVFGLQDGYDSQPQEPTASMSATRFVLRSLDVQYWNGTDFITLPNGEIRNNQRLRPTVAFWPPVTTSKIRVVVNDAAGAAARIVDVEALTPYDYLSACVSRTNVALGAGASALTSLTGFPPSAAVNGDRTGRSWGDDPATGSGWHSHVTPSWPQPQPLTIDFGSTRTINEVDVYSVRDDYAQSVAEPDEGTKGEHYQLAAFDVEVSTDNTAWTLVPGGHVTGNQVIRRRLTFPPLQARYLRVIVSADGADPNVPDAARIVEVEAYTPYDFLPACTNLSQ